MLQTESKTNIPNTDDNFQQNSQQNKPARLVSTTREVLLKGKP